MKVLAALAFIGLAVSIGATDANADEKTARLTDPATTGATPQAHTLWVPQEGRIEQTADTPARPNGLSDVEVHGIRDAIRGQILALAARDADRAYSFLAPSTKDYFADAAAFLRTLTRQMEPLAATRTYAFSEIGREATDAIQDVVLGDPKGQEWLARFTLERQPDGSWGIKSCKVEPVVGSRI